jgi:hypothetical protein
VKLQKDLKEFIELLNSHGVEYLVVGGHAVAYHGHPRYTGDIDFFVRPTAQNAAGETHSLFAYGTLRDPERERPGNESRSGIAVRSSDR